MSKSSDSSNPVPIQSSLTDLKEFVKHLRLTHFTLFITCIALIFGLSSESRRNTDKALEQIQQIVRLTNTTLKNKKWLQQLAKRKFEKENLEAPIQSFDQTEMRVQFDNGLTQLTKSSVIKISNIPVFNWSVPVLYPKKEPNKWIPGWGLDPNDPIEMKQPKTIEDFKTLWNQLENRYVVVPLNVNGVNIRFWAEESSRLLFSGKLLSSDEKTSPLIPKLDKPRWGVVSDSNYTSLFIFKEGGLDDVFPDIKLKDIRLGEYNRKQVTFTIYVYITAERINLHAQKYLSDEVEASWKSGKFSNTFPEIAQLTKNLESVELDQMQFMLENIRKRTKSDIEIVGIRLPSRFLGIWGMIFLGGIQIYLLIHFEQFKQLIATQNIDVGVPWLALYRGIKPRFAYLVSAAGLPVVCTLWIIITEIPLAFGLWNSVGISLIGCIPIGLAIVTVRSTIIFWKQIDQA